MTIAISAAERVTDVIRTYDTLAMGEEDSGMLLLTSVRIITKERNTVTENDTLSPLSSGSRNTTGLSYASNINGPRR